MIKALHNSKTENLIWFSVFVFFYWFYAHDVIYLASESLRMLEAFDQDEGDFLWLIIQAFNHNTFDIPLYCYGHLYYNIGLGILYIMRLFTDNIHDKEMLLTLRYVSLLFHFATVYWWYKLVKKYFSSFSAWLSALLLLAGSQNLLYYTTNLHPDTTQLFFIVGFFWFLLKGIEEKRIKAYLYAVVFAGLAFSVKYAGLLLLGVAFIIYWQQHIYFSISYFLKALLNMLLGITLAVLFYPKVFTTLTTQTFNTQKTQLVFGVFFLYFLIAVFSFLVRKKHRVFIDRLIDFQFFSSISAIVFFLAFSITSPYEVNNFNFLKGISDISNYVSNSYDFSAGNHLEQWINTITKNKVMYAAVFWLAWISIPVAIYQKNKKEFLIPFITWFLIYHAVLFIKVSRVYPHYYLPVLPVYFLLFALLWENIISFEHIKNYKRYLYAVFLSSVSLYVLYHVYIYKKERIKQIVNAPEIRMGKWIKKNIDRQTTFILADKYTYIPGEYTIFKEWGLQQEHQDAFHPTHILVTHKIMQRYPCDKLVDIPTDKQPSFAEKCRFYEKLFTDTGTYRLIHREDSIFLFQVKLQ